MLPVKNAKPLSRLDIRRRFDKPTKCAVLEYTGKGLAFHDNIYGYPEGVYLVVSYDEMPYPGELRALSDDLGVPIDALSCAKMLKDAAVDALIAEGLVKTPQMLQEFAEPEVFWQRWDLNELERRHMIALARVVELKTLAERELRLRAAKITLDPGIGPIPQMLGMPSLPTVAAPAPPAVEVETVYAPTPSAPAPTVAQVTLARVEEAVGQARETELAQRLPNGARRALQKLVKAHYVIRGADAPSVRGSLLEAMQDAEQMAAGMRRTPACDVEVTVVDWDGEWPVVVRRYGEGGRTVYRVEEALRRAGAEEKAA